MPRDSSVAEQVDDYIRLFFGVDARNVRAFLKESPELRERLETWLCRGYAPASLGDCLAAQVLATLIGDIRLEFPTEYLLRCELAQGYLPIPADDDRWGSVRPVVDVFASVQGTILKGLCHDIKTIDADREKVRSLILSGPWNLEASDTLFEYRKLSEILAQAHHCLALEFYVDGKPADRISAVVASTLQRVLESAFATKFATPLFRLSVLSTFLDLAVVRKALSPDVIWECVARLLTPDGLLEYRLADKVDERAGSRSRSSRDQEYAWTYSTAYGSLLLAHIDRRSSEEADLLRHVLRARLADWPNAEPLLTLKEFVTPLASSASAYSALVGAIGAST
jgi:hypothetical protein